MKQVYFYFLLALCCINFKVKAQSCALDQVGTTTVSSNSALADMAIDASNKVYSLAFNSATKTIELKSATIASSWTLVATVPTVTNTTVKPALAINKIGEIIAFIRDEPNGKVGKVYKSTGGAFTQIGGAISAGPVSDLSIAFSATNEIYIAYTDVTPSNLATVKRWSGSAWLDVGIGGIASTGASKFNSLIIDNTNTPILAYQDGDVGFATTVSKYDGTSWSPFFTSASGPTSNTTLRCASNGDYYLGYIEGSDASVVQKYDGSSWNQLGFNITGVSSGAGNYEMSIDPANSPYIIATTTSSMVTAYRFDGGTGWLQVPAGFINTNISTMVNIAFDKFGAPYFGYVDVPNNNALNVKTLTSLVSIITQPNSTTLCNGNSGMFSITTGGPGSPTYNWQSNSLSGFLDVIAPYSQSSNTLNVTANPTVNQDKIRCVVDIGCRNVISNTATLTVTSLSITTTSTNPSCSGGNDGVITSMVIGGLAPYSYTWTPFGGSTSTASFLTAGIFTLNVADANTCATSTVISLTNPPTIYSSFSGNMMICNGSSTTLTVTSTGGTGPYTYSWTPSASLSSSTGSVVTANPSSMQTYNVQATDVLGCVATTTVMVDIYANQPTIIANSSSGSICNGSSVTLTATDSNVNMYVWNPGGLSGSTQNVTPSSTTIYTVVGTNTVTGCQASSTVAVNVNPLPTANAGTTRTLTCVNTSTTLTGSAVGATTYNWSGPGILSGATTLSPTIFLPGTYSFVSMSAAGCISATSTVAVTQNTISPSPTASTTGTLTCSTLTVALNGAPGTGVSYQWTGPGFSGGTTSQNATATSAGNYTLLVTNSINGCTNTAVTSVSQNTTTPTVSASTSTTAICAGSTATLSATGVGVNTYVWQPGSLAGATRTVSPASTTIYTVTGTNTVTGCSAFSNITITVNPLPTITAGPTKSLTCASSFTTVTCSSVGGTSYNWTGSGIISGYTTTNCNVSSPGIKSVFAISAEGCVSPTATVSVVTNTTSPTATASSSGTITCVTSTVALTGGPGTGVTYQWSGPGFSSGTTTQNAGANAVGTYTLKVTSSVNSCTNTATTIVTQNITPPTATASNSSTLTCSTTTASLFGAGGGSYNWSGPSILSGSTTASPIINLPGCYNLTVTAANGCTATANTCVNQNTISPIVSGGVSGTLTCITSAVNAITSTSTTPVSYNWTGAGIVSGTGTGTITVVQSGIYNYTVTNTINGCNSIGTRIVSQNTVSPTGTNAGMDQTITCGAPTVTLTGSVSSPTNVTYSWAGGVCGSTTSSVTSVCSGGVYTLTTTDPINGCTDSDIIQVNSNVTIPTVTLSSNSATITCVTLTVSVSASTTASPVTYSWSPSSGIVGGSGATNTPYFDAPGTYSLVVKDLTNGCSSSLSSNVVSVSQDITSPSITISASPSIICSGNSSTLTAIAGSNINYNWLPGSLNGPVQTVNPNSTTLYTVVATNTISGCTNSETITLTVNSTPALSISGNTNICKGSTSTLTGSGAASYTWNTGANTTSISVSPTITTTYTLNGDNGNGCSSSLPITISIIPNKSINGVITSTAGATTGDVILYKYTIGLSQWDSITTVPFTSSYSFANIDSALYVVRAIPTATNIQVTYGDNAITWQNATIINHGCSNNSAQNIGLVALENFVVGPGVLSGTIIEEDGFGQRINNEFKPLAPGEPIGGIVVKGGRNPGGQMFVQTTTNAAGQYTLSGLPINSQFESYFIFVDIPGLDTNGTYHIVISSSDAIHNGLNFTVDSMFINPIGSITTINSQEAILENNILIYPNPSRDLVNIKYEIIKSANISINLYNILGEKTREILPLTNQENGKFEHSINLKDLSDGVYFINFTINNSENYIKLIKTN